MKKFVVFACEFVREEEGATALEYGLLVILIAIVMSVGALIFGQSVNSLFSSTGSSVNSASAGAIASP